MSVRIYASVSRQYPSQLIAFGASEVVDNHGDVSARIGDITGLLAPEAMAGSVHNGAKVLVTPHCQSRSFIRLLIEEC